MLQVEILKYFEHTELKIILANTANSDILFYGQYTQVDRFFFNSVVELGTKRGQLGWYNVFLT